MQLGAGEEEVFHVEMRVILFLIHNYAIRYWVWNAQTRVLDGQTDGRTREIGIGRPETIEDQKNKIEESPTFENKNI